MVHGSYGGGERKGKELNEKSVNKKAQSVILWILTTLVVCQESKQGGP